jgi:hypothetical protein
MIHRHEERHGHTLIELLVVITAVSILLTLGVALIELLFKLNWAGRERVETLATLGRLAHDFRADVRSADVSQIGPEDEESGRSQSLTLRFPDVRSVEYTFERRRIVRIERRDQELVRREIYRLATLRGAFELSRRGPNELVALVVDRRPEKDRNAPAREFRIEASAGADHRFDRGARP